MQKFEVGEQVILISVYQPECNGEYTVSEACFDVFENLMTGLPEEGWSYQLKGAEGWWMQSALRKKPDNESGDWADCVWRPEEIVA